MSGGVLLHGTPRFFWELVFYSLTWATEALCFSAASHPRKGTDMLHSFEIASGTITGRHHISVGRGSQDALCVLATKQAIVGVVCDGCGSEAHSEVGAHLMSRRIAQNFLILAKAAPMAHPQDLMGLSNSHLLEDLAEISRFLGGDRKQAIFDHLLFSVVGFVVGLHWSFIFYSGDGWWWGGTSVNVKDGLFSNQILPAEGNQPDYPGYMLLANDRTKFDLKLSAYYETKNLSVIGAGTDGLTDFVENKETLMPGRADKVGPLSQFWTEDRYYANPDAIRRKLWLCAQEHRRADWNEQQILKTPGLLLDDTSLICVRRKA